MGGSLKERILLETIVNQPGYVVLDTSLFGFFGQALLEHLDSVSSIGALDRDIILNDLDETYRLINIVAGNNQIFIPSKVIEEQGDFVGILKRKQKKMGIRRYNPSGEFFPQDYDKGGKPLTLVETTPSLLARATETQALLCRMLERRKVSYDGGSHEADFRDFYGLLITYSDIMSLKKRKANYHSTGKGNEWNDEHIVATGVYFLLLNRCPVSFGNHDVDFAAILTFLQQAAFSPTFKELASHKYFRTLQQVLQQNPVTNYFLDVDASRNLLFKEMGGSNGFLMRKHQWDAVKAATFQFYMKRRQIFMDDPGSYERKEMPKIEGAPQ
ncbi:hypothetical protein HYU13_00675 [Candidatus Woesearchaeota archaeon]|nr:hypothetical protein [Candidatus Woesearchaeota archaeon]